MPPNSTDEASNAGYFTADRHSFSKVQITNTQKQNDYTKEIEKELER